MKKAFMVVALMLTLAYAADSVFAYASSTTEVISAPDLLIELLQLLQSVPYIGPALVFFFKWIAIIAPIMTALSLCAQAILSIPEVVARFNGAHALAEKIKYWSDKIIYWLSYLSIRNAQKKPKL
jgi:hypothetical protein